MHAVTVGRGNTRPQGWRAQLDDEDLVGSLHRILISHTGVEAWLCPATFDGDYKKLEKFEAASAIAADADYVGQDGEHSELPNGVTEVVYELAEGGRLPGNLFYFTPRGFRILTVLVEPVEDIEYRSLLGMAHDALIEKALGDAGLLAHREGELEVYGFVLDRKVSEGASQAVFTPNATVREETRGAGVIVLDPKPAGGALEEVAHARELGENVVPIRSTTEVTAPSSPRRDFSAAVDAWNLAHPTAWPKSGGRCPACGHNGCFGTLPGGSRWACHSANHGPDSGGVGIDGAACWYGDALDLEAHRRGVSRQEVLYADGYLEPISAESVPDVVPPATGICPPLDSPMASPSETPAFSDDWLALRFAELMRDEIRWCDAFGFWFLWNGSVWEQDETQRVREAARVVARDIAKNIPEDEEGKPVIRPSLITSRRAIEAIESLSKSEHALAATKAQWDRNPWILNTPSGTIDLETGQLFEPRRTDYCTKQTAVPPAQRCPRWVTFIDQVTDGDADLAGFLQRMIGYACAGVVKEHALFFLFGAGGNGKGTFLNTVTRILGSYAQTAPMELFTVQRNEQHPTELARLRGARLVQAQETEEGRRFALSRVKQLTGGDTIAARFIGKDFFEFEPQATVIIAGNHKPAIKTVDEAIRRRLYLVPFLTNFSELGIVDHDLPEKLVQEMPGILRWMVDGCLAWQREGLNAPEAVRAATSEYLDAQDLLGRFIEECCELVPNDGETSGELFEAYCRWMEKSNERPVTRKVFGEALGKRPGITRRKTKGRMVYDGIILTDAMRSGVSGAVQ